MTIQFRVFTTIAAIAFIIIVVGNAVGSWFMTKSVSSTIEANILSTVDVANQYVAKEIELQKLRAAIVANKIGLSYQAGNRRGTLKPLLVEHSEYMGLAVFDSAGLVDSWGDCAPPADLVKEPFMRTAMTGGQAISTTMHTPDGRLVMYVSAPISKGLVLAAALPGTHFSHAVSNFRFYRTGHLFIGDRDGHVISNNNSEWVQKRVNFIEMAKTNSDYKKISEIILRVIGGGRGVDQFSFNGEERICAFRPVSSPTESWFIGIVAPLSESALKDIPKSLLLLAITLLLLSIIAAFPAAAYLKRPFEELDTQTSVLKSVFDSSPNYIFCLDMDLKYIRINKKMAQAFNILESDAVGKRDSEVLRLPHDTLMEIERINRQVLAERATHTVEETVPDFWGRPYCLETVKSPLMKNGEMIGILGIAHDITHRKAMEEELVAASHAKSAFLARMSHELRTPLNVIIGLTDLMLEDSELPDSIKQNLAAIGNAGDTLLCIVNDILDISKIDSGKLELIPVEYQTTSMLNDTIVLLKTYIGEKPIDFKLHISKDLPATLHGDELRIKQILNNLLSNAVKYTQEGSVELAVESERDGDDVWMGIAVKDTGIGIPKDELPNLFNEYYKADAKKNRKTEGTGLGLSITRRLVEMMDGKITAESEYGKGSTFRLRLRQGFVSDETIGTSVAGNLSNFSYSDSKRMMSRKIERANLEHVRVLVVDDMQTNLIVTAGLMQKYKMKVDCVTSGQASIDRISNQAPIYDAIFMDHMMPGMNGIEAAKAIRSLGTDYAKNIPIIALTANAVLGSEAMFLENGFQGFLSKPVDILRLDAVLHKWVQNRIPENHADAPPNGPTGPPPSTGGGIIDIPVVNHADAPPSGQTEPPLPAGVVAVDALRVSPAEAPPSDPEEPLLPSGIPVDIPGIDDKRASYLYDGDMEIFLPVLRSYAEHSPGYLEKLRNATEEGLAECVIIAHGVKGASANICAEKVRAVAAEMEASARKGDFAKFAELRGAFLEDAARLIGDIKAWLENHDKNSEKPLLEAPSGDILEELRQSCEAYDMSRIDRAMEILESSNYKNGGNLVEWLKGKIGTMEVEEVVARLSKEDPFAG